MLIFFLLGHLSYAQDINDPKLDRALDSLTTNPQYSYLQLSEISNDRTASDKLRATARLHLGSYFNNIGVVDSAIFYAQRSLFHLNEKKHIAKAYRILGSSYRRSGKIDKALDFLYESLKISEEIQYKEMISITKSDLGIHYVNKKEYDKALKFLHESIEAAETDQAVYGNYVNIGVLYFYKGDLDNAQKYFMKAFELTPLEKDPKVASTLALNIGDVFYEKKDLKKAGEYFDKSKEIADDHGFKDKSINASVHKAKVVQGLGNPNEAIFILNNALEDAKELSNLEIQKRIHERLVSIYSDLDDYKAANKALRNFHIVKDSIANLRQEKEVTELEVKYETATKEKEILELKEDQLMISEEIKRQRLLKKVFFIGFLIILIPIIGLLYVYYQKLQVRNKYNEQKEEMHKERISSFLKERELQLANTYALAQNEERDRIARELHDSIGGNLAAIKLQMVDMNHDDNMKQDIIQQLDDTYEQVREIAHDLVPKKISQTAFTSYISDYIKNIENVSAPDITFIPHPVERVNAIDENQKAEIFKILQELLTNALKHAKAKVIEICLNAYDDSIEILFEDDGVGFEPKKTSKGIGLSNIGKRLRMLEAKMDIDTAKNRGTAIRIEIPTAP
ncbi:tetratricopeptide repeat-containing sensor histidine kinase [Sungkyunkwania multivorans]|uniref:tetratricopeptide repeat-containing sensor histidine kinase n=1 Tax=Sungkyunkwania multivorans TaxID=1173618 RepID=UPI0036DD2753